MRYRSQPRIYKYNQTARECQPFFQKKIELSLKISLSKGFSRQKKFTHSFNTSPSVLDSLSIVVRETLGT